MTIFILWLLFVIGGWCNLRPGPVKRDWTAAYQYPTNLFFALDRLLNAVLLGEVRETISSRIGRLHNGSIANVLIDILALDWPHGDNPGHCRKYIGT